MINIDAKLLEALQSSSCFGIAHDEASPECKQCDVGAQCKAKSEGATVPLPSKSNTVKADVKKDTVKTDTVKKDTVKKTTTAPKKETVKKESAPKSGEKPAVDDANLPDFKKMTLEDLKKMAADSKVEWKDYGNDNITRMRLIMTLKKFYQG